MIGRVPTTIVMLLAVLSLGCERLEHAIGEDHGPAWEGREVSEPVVVDGAERWTEHLDVAQVEGESFFVVSREGQITNAPCTVCHDGSLRPVPEGQTRRAHWEIDRAHGNAAGVTCATCHSVEGPDLLRNVHGEKVEFDQVHQLCGTCHFEQVNAWKGGAHGKRAGAWAGERIVEPCTSCHDPHDPSFPVRLPTTFNPPPAEPGEEH